MTDSGAARKGAFAVAQPFGVTTGTDIVDRIVKNKIRITNRNNHNNTDLEERKKLSSNANSTCNKAPSPLMKFPNH